MSTNANGTFEAVPAESTTKDGRDVVYVSAPSLESVEQIVAAKEREADARLRDVRVGARVQALGAATQLRAFSKDGNDVDFVLETAQRFADFLLADEESN